MEEKGCLILYRQKNIIIDEIKKSVESLHPGKMILGNQIQRT